MKKLSVQNLRDADTSVCHEFIGQIVSYITLEYGENKGMLDKIMLFLYLLNHSEETEKILTEAIDRARVNQSPPRPEGEDVDSKKQAKLLADNPPEEKR